MTRARSSGYSLIHRILLIPPAFSTEAQTLRAHTFHRVVFATLIILLFFLMILAWLQPGTLPRRINTIGFLVTMAIPLLWLNRMGKTRLASWLFIGGFILLLAHRAYTSGGISAPASALFVIFALVAGLLLGTIGAIVCAVIFTGIGAGLVLAERTGSLPAPQLAFSPTIAWIYNCLCLAMAVVVQRQITATMTASIDRAHGEIQERREAQRRLSLALQAGEVGVWSYDVATSLLTADRRLFELYSIPMPPDGTIPIDVWSSRLHPEDREMAMGKLNELLNGAHSLRTEFRAIHGDGSIRYIEGAGTSVTNETGTVIRVVGVNRDVTEQRLAEQERTQLVHTLDERVKESRLLHATARLLQPDRPANQALFQELVDQLPRAWQYPECCEARIAYGDIVVTTAKWRETPWRQAISFASSNGSGIIEVVYLEQRPLAAEGVFLAE